MASAINPVSNIAPTTALTQSQHKASDETLFDLPN